MSVFTPVSVEEARALLGRYTLGELESLEGIAQGVENTNYFLDTTTGHYVLTLFEKIPAADLAFYMGLMHHLSERGVRCPAPVALTQGGFLTPACGKPAAIVTRLPGAARLFPTLEDCRVAGALLADLHTAAAGYEPGLANWRGQTWREAFAERVRPKLEPGEASLMDAENRFQAAQDDSVLPQGIIHGDLFRDNVLWDEEGEPGVIDFYFACDDTLLFDVAVTANDWCVGADAVPDPARVAALLEGYDSRRPFTDLERQHWPAMLRRAALRTWLGRLDYNHYPRDAQMTILKDHAYSRLLLEHHIGHARPMPEAG
jgi:homoserine kinase type II